MGNLLSDKNLDSAYHTLADLNRALKAILGGQGGQANTGDPILDELVQLDWSPFAVKDFLEYVSGPSSAADSIEDAKSGLEKAAQIIGGSWTGAAGEACLAKIEAVLANYGMVGDYLEVMAQDLDADDGEARVAGAAAQSASSIMDRLTDAVNTTADRLAEDTKDAANAVIWGSPTDPDYVANQQKVTAAYEELKASVQKQIKEIAAQVMPLTQRHTANLPITSPA